jgi:hypothetical protein
MNSIVSSARTGPPGAKKKILSYQLLEGLPSGQDGRRGPLPFCPAARFAVLAAINARAMIACTKTGLY